MLATFVGLACGPTVQIEDGGDTEADSGEPTAETGLVGEGPGTGPADTGFVDTGSDDGDVPAQTNQVDILFVVDNSGSMGEEQAALVAAVPALIETLALIDVDYRIAVTTTDNSNPWCPGTTPEGGDFRLSSCRSRLSEFVFSGAQMVDAAALACLDICGAEELTVVPTLGSDGQTAPRPWIEMTGAALNIEGLSVEEALACALPQGINGCGFEQQLESLYKAVRRTENDGEAAFGFFRPGSLPVVVVVTDEADCSYQNESIFLPDDDRFYWSLPDEATPTSAVCWNAGVSCEGSDCMSVNLGLLGEEVPESQAVMRPVSRYIDLLQSLEDQARMVTPGVDVLVEVIGGFTSDGGVVYQPTTDQAFQDNFGIGPGCSSPNGDAVPMVRTLEVASAMATGGAASVSSICDPTFDAAMASLDARIRAELGF